MNYYIVTLRFTGLTGEYDSKVEVRARNPKSASRKASQCIGNRDGYVVSIVQASMREED